jgi:hypothetical protein
MVLKTTQQKLTDVLQLYDCAQCIRTLDCTHQDGELAGVELALQRLSTRIKTDKPFPVSCCFVLFVQCHSTTHVEFPRSQKLDSCSPGNGTGSAAAT